MLNKVGQTHEIFGYLCFNALSTA